MPRMYPGLRWLGAFVLTLILGTLVAFAIKYLLSLVCRDALVCLYLKVLAFTGAFGGIIYGLFTHRGRFTWAYPDPEDSLLLQAGSVGDAIIGIGGAWGIFMVLGRTIKLGDDTETILVLVGLGVVAGLGAPSLLQLLTRRLERLVQETAKDTARKTAIEEMRPRFVRTGLDDAQRLVGFFDACEPNVKSRMRDLLEDTLSGLEGTLSVDSNNPFTYVTIGRIKKRLAMIAAASQEQATLLSDAISACTTALELNPDLEAAYYNRACYRVFKATGHQRDENLLKEGLLDLARSIEIDKGNKEIAWEDLDFKILREQKNPEFYRLVGQKLGSG